MVPIVLPRQHTTRRARQRRNVAGHLPWPVLTVIAGGLSWIAWSIAFGWPSEANEASDASVTGRVSMTILDPLIGETIIVDSTGGPRGSFVVFQGST